MENWEPSIEPPIKDLELWLDQQADQLGTPSWWEELKAIPGITYLCKFTQKIHASFCILEIQSRASPDQSYSAPPAPKCLNRGAFLPERLEYQDVQRRPKLLTEAYCWCLQYWAEKVYPPISLEVHPLAESVRELCQAMGEFITITTQDILEGLKMDRPADSCWPPPTTIFNWVLDSPTKGHEKNSFAVGNSQQAGVPRPWGRASPFISAQLSTHLPGAPSIPAFLPTSISVVGQSSAPTQIFVDTTTNTQPPGPAQPGGKNPTDVSAIGRGTSRISSISASRIVRGNSTRSMYLNTISTSIGSNGHRQHGDQRRSNYRGRDRPAVRILRNLPLGRQSLSHWNPKLNTHCGADICRYEHSP